MVDGIGGSGGSTKRVDTDCSLWILVIVCANSSATEMTTIFLHFFFSSLSGMESVTRSLSIGLALIRSIAGPERTGCTQQENTRAAP